MSLLNHQYKIKDIFKMYRNLTEEEKRELLSGAADAFHRRDQDNNGTYYMDLPQMIEDIKKQE